MRWYSVISVPAFLYLVLVPGNPSSQEIINPDDPANTWENNISSNDFSVTQPPVTTSEYFPCSQCHRPDGSTSGDRPAGSVHAKIEVDGHIGPDHSCSGCHNIKEPDKLQLFSGRRIDLSASSILCGQCHTSVYTNWQSGIHGKIIGNWDRDHQYTPCTGCHDPHQPEFKSQLSAPPPIRPENTLR